MNDERQGRQTRRLAKRQSLLTLAFALLVGLLVGGVELALDWQAVREDVADSLRQESAQIGGSAAEAAYQLNSMQAENVVQGLMQIELLQQAQLYDNFGNLLAVSSRAAPGQAHRELGEMLLAGVGRHREVLYYADRAGERPGEVGALQIEVSPGVVGERFFRLARNKLLARVAWALVLSLLLAVVFHFYIIRPLVRLNRQIDAVDPAAPGERQLTPARWHADDELGQVVATLNRLFAEAQRGILARNAAEAELAASNQVLEARVAARTRDLQAAMHELESKKELAEQATRAKSEFLANMSHEIRTPLNAILGMAEILSGTPLTVEQKAYVDIFNTAGNNLLNIINDILDLSKVEAGQIELYREDFALEDLLHAQLDLLALPAHEKGLDLALDYSPDLPRWVCGDGKRLQQCLVNLVGNAIKFTHVGGVVVRICPGSTADSVLFEVADSGIGIAVDKLDSIFAAFTQADGSITRRYGGTGLGLTITQRLIRLMGGEIGVRSEPGQGTTFHFQLPLPAASVDPTPWESLPLDGKRVLVVDDFAVNRLIVRRELEPFGVAVEECASAGEAVARLTRAAPPEILLLDCQMPEIDGFALIRMLRERRLAVGVPTVMLSSADSQEQRRIADELGIRFLIKPIKRKELLHVLRLELAAGSGPVAGGTAPASAAPASAPGRALRILLAEDNLLNVKVLQGLLAKTPHRLDVVGDGAQAVAASAAATYDLILMDLQMPVMDGYQATLEIRRREREHGLPPLPIYALTANALKEDEARSHEVGCDKHLSKPINARALFAALDELTGSRRADD